MRVLTRMRPLVAIAALLLLTLAPIAQANVPGRPIDRPEGPPDVVPTQIGEPDPGHGLPRDAWRSILFEALLARFPALRLAQLPVAGHVAPSRLAVSRVVRHGWR